MPASGATQGARVAAAWRRTQGYRPRGPHRASAPGLQAKGVAGTGTGVAADDDDVDVVVLSAVVLLLAAAEALAMTPTTPSPDACKDSFSPGSTGGL